MPDKPLTPSGVLREQRVLAGRWRDPVPRMQRYMQKFALAHLEGTGPYRTSQMFYPWRPEQSLDQARRFMNSLGRDIYMAAPYQVTKRMTGVLTDVCATTAEKEKMEHVDAAELPSEYGFLWYDEPVRLLDWAGGWLTMRAISWGPVRVTLGTKDWLGRQAAPQTRDGCRLAIWCHLDDPCGYDSAGLPADVFGDLQLNHTITFAFGERFPVRPEKALGDSVFHYAHVTWMLLGSEIAVAHRPRIESGAAFRARGKLRHSEVTVITLRRALAEQKPEPGHKHVEWTCHWLVQGFWRHLEDYDHEVYPKHRAVGDRKPGLLNHCITCGARCTWVRAHFRGPEDLPLKRSEKLSRLVR